MSSHREAPQISQDPVADNTDVYAFVSPDKADTVTLVANYIPLQGPAGGPNFYAFGDDVLYQIHVRNGQADTDTVTFQFRFTTEIGNLNTFLYNTGPITSLTDATFNKRQSYSVTRVDRTGSRLLMAGIPTPPCNIGPHSTPNYPALAQAAVTNLPDGSVVFAGQRAEEFYVDLGAVFDLLDLRPFQNLLAIDPMAAAGGIDATQGLNVNTIAIQVPKKLLTADGSTPTDPTKSSSVIGVFASASRQMGRVYDSQNSGRIVDSGPFVQVSRLGNPLFNEVLVPLGKKDLWNSRDPNGDSAFLARVQTPELVGLLAKLYPGVFPNLAAYHKPRADLVAILLTGIPSGVVPGFQNNTGSTQADLLRLNMAVAPSANPNNLGLLANDAAGFPNGRRILDDVTTIELRALAGAALPLVDKSFTPDAAVSKLTTGVSNTNNPPLDIFPYMGVPNAGFDVTPGSADRAAGTAPSPTTGSGTSGSSGGATSSGGTGAGSSTPVGAPATGDGGPSGGSRDLLGAGGGALAAAAAAGTVAA
ncbi:MAG: DUF4331 domain-containing protein, partial [Acidimicrobiales bacterium]